MRFRNQSQAVVACLLAPDYSSHAALACIPNMLPSADDALFYWILPQTRRLLFLFVFLFFGATKPQEGQSTYKRSTMLHLSLSIGIAVLDSARLDWVAVLASYQEPSTACSDWHPLPRSLGGWCQSDCWRRADGRMNRSWLGRCEVDQNFWGFTTADFLLRSGPESNMN